MPLKFSHKTLAETHDFRVRLPSWAEIGSSLAATHREGGERILECLLECKELHDAEVHACVESNASFVGAKSTVHLNPVTTVDVDFSPVIRPWYSEHNHPFGLNHPLKNLEIYKVRVRSYIRCYAFYDFPDVLMKLTFTRITCDEFRHEPIDVVRCEFIHCLET